MGLQKYREWIKDITELEPDIPMFEIEVKMSEVIHPHAGVKGLGVAYIPDEDREFALHWHYMLAPLRDKDIIMLCHGRGVSVPRWNVRSGRLVSCHVSMDPISSDIGMAHMDKLRSEHEGAPRSFSNTKPLVVNFLVTRDDGVGFRLHPSHNENKISCKVAKRTSPARIPQNGGIYFADGPGTFRKILKCSHLEALRFDRACSEIPRTSSRGPMYLRMMWHIWLAGLSRPLTLRAGLWCRLHPTGKMIDRLPC